MQLYGGGMGSTDDYANTMNSNSSLIKTNLYHHASGGPVAFGAPGGSGNVAENKGNRRELLLSAKTRATPQELNEKRNSMLSKSLACVNFKG